MQISEHVLRAGARLFGLTMPDLHFLGGMDGSVYEYVRDGRGMVLKYTPIAEDRVATLHEKYDFISYLGAHGVPVARPLPSGGGHLIELVEAEKGADVAPLFAISTFIKAPGKHVIGQKNDAWTPGLIRTWGRVLGQMHALTKEYPRKADSMLGDWRQEWQGFADWCREAAVLEKWQALREKLCRLPETRDSYGLIHNDLHQYNFLVLGSQLTIIDFDVCNYHWFMTDLGIALFHALWEGHTDRAQSREDFARDFWQHLMAGYGEENALDRFWLAQLPTFLDYRRILLYIVFYDAWGKNPNPWQAHYLRTWQQGILNDIPVVALEL